MCIKTAGLFYSLFTRRLFIHHNARENATPREMATTARKRPFSAPLLPQLTECRISSAPPLKRRAHGSYPAGQLPDENSFTWFRALAVLRLTLQMAGLRAHDAGNSHRCIIGFEVGKLIVIGNKLEAAGQAPVIMGVTCMEEDPSCAARRPPEGFCSRPPNRQRCVWRNRQDQTSAGTACGPASSRRRVAFDVDEGGFLPEGALG